VVIDMGGLYRRAEAEDVPTKAQENTVRRQQTRRGVPLPVDLDDVIDQTGLTVSTRHRTHRPPRLPAAKLTDGTLDDNQPFLDQFPYLGTPNSGSEVRPGTPAT
jgi:hypothetical protein